MNSQDWGRILGSAVSVYDPQYGQAVGGLFGVTPTQPAPPPPQQQALFAGTPTDGKVPTYVWVGAGVLAVGLVAVLFLARK